MIEIDALLSIRQHAVKLTAGYYFLAEPDMPLPVTENQNSFLPPLPGFPVTGRGLVRDEMRGGGQTIARLGTFTRRPRA